MDALKRNTTIKIMSVLMAIILWLYVVNLDNPQDKETLNIPLRILNEETLQTKGIYIKNEDYRKTISIAVKGRVEELDVINESDFTATIDFSKVKSEKTKQLKIDVKYIGDDIGINDIKIEYLTPLVVELDLEKESKSTFTVVLEPSGNIKNGYSIVKSIFTPEKVLLEGPVSLLESVDSIKAIVNVADLDMNTSVSAVCKAFDKKGNEIKIYGKNDKKVYHLSGDLSVNADLYIAKEVPIVPVITGKPARNYITGYKGVTPEKVYITGLPEVIDKIDVLRTESISIENASESINVSRLIDVPEGVTLYNVLPEVEVKVDIEQLSEKEFIIKSDDINFGNAEIDNSLNYSVLSNDIIIKLKGSKTQLDKLDIASLKPSIDVAGLENGTYKLPLKIVLPDMVKLVLKYNIEVKIEKR